MLKVVIADDQAKIRRGLCEAIDWQSEGIELAGCAKNGVELLKLVEEHDPEICLIDVCMPIINGMEAIKIIKEKNPDLECVVITGYDEFVYAHEAIKLSVFDYILKPVNEERLISVVRKVAQKINERRLTREKLEFAEQLLIKNMPVLKDKLLKDIVDGSLSEEEIEKQLRFHSMDFGPEPGLIILNTTRVTYHDISDDEWNNQLLNFAIRNLLEKTLEKCSGMYAVGMDSRENIFALLRVDNEDVWETATTDVTRKISEELKLDVRVFKTRIINGLKSVAEAYEGLIKSSEQIYSDIITKAKEYVDRKYSDPELNFRDMAQELNVSISYLSRQFKKEIGLTFIDYLTRVRIQRSLELMRDPVMKIYEITDRVGYKSQHYFCVSFKRTLGVSPTEYRQKFNLSK